MLAHRSASELAAAETKKAFSLHHPFHHAGGLRVYGHDVGRSHGRVLGGFGAEAVSYSCGDGRLVEDLVNASCVQGCTTGATGVPRQNQNPS